MGKVLEKGEPDFTELEKSGGFELVWMTLDQAIDQLQKDAPTDYQGIFIRERDLAFLEKAKELIS